MDKLVFATAAAALALTALLASFAQTLEPAPARISELSAAHDGKLVRVSGTIASVRENNGNYFITLCSGDYCVAALVFEKTARRMRERNLELSALRKGSRIAVWGVVRESQARGFSLAVISPNAIEVLN